MKRIGSEGAREYARQVLSQFGVATAPIAVEKIIKQRGIVVQYSPLDDELSGMALIKDGVSIIGVNALHHPNRQRFTLAHELGHHVMHSALIDGTVHIDKSFSVLARDILASKGTDDIEIEANAFAAELLMPKEALSAVINFGQIDIDDDQILKSVAKKFKVSLSALQYRLLALT